MIYAKLVAALANVMSLRQLAVRIYATIVLDEVLLEKHPAGPIGPTYRAIDLHFHDLRGEAGSRLFESRLFDQHLVQRFLDHANLSTARRYLTTTRLALQRAMTALDAKHEAERTERSKATPAERGGRRTDPTRNSAALTSE